MAEANCALPVRPARKIHALPRYARASVRLMQSTDAQYQLGMK
jgi:hypothetical protein